MKTSINDQANKDMTIAEQYYCALANKDLTIASQLLHPEVTLLAL